MPSCSISRIIPPTRRPSRTIPCGVWAMAAGWKAANRFPVYAIPGASGHQIMSELALYAGNLTTVPNGHQLTETYPPNDFVRLVLDITLSKCTLHSVVRICNMLGVQWLFENVKRGIFESCEFVVCDCCQSKVTALLTL